MRVLRRRPQPRAPRLRRTAGSGPRRLVVGGLLALFVGALLNPPLAVSASVRHTQAAEEPAATTHESAASAGHASHGYHGPYFGENNFPPGCTRDFRPDNPANICYRMRDVSSLNPLDSPKIDVLILVPVSPTAERDMRIMRQAVEMWEGGVEYLAPRMGLDWLNAVDFHITVDYVDLTGDDGGEFTTYPVVDPEIVVLAANGAGAGLGIDALALVSEDGVPCHSVANPFDFEAWEALPGFDSHQSERSGTYKEDCGGQGGNFCITVNGMQDPLPSEIDWLNTFFVVAHEVGHCLSVGHVGDGAEGSVEGQYWGPVPFDEVMSYANDWRMSVGGKPGPDRCVSTLDVETFATRMSRYLDVDGDGVAGSDADVIQANDQIGVSGDPMQVMHPGDYLFASSTGAPEDCPQPDLGLVPGPRTDWTPEPVASVSHEIEVTTPAEGATVNDPSVVVTGTVAERSLQERPAPSATSVTIADDPADATSPWTEIVSVTATADETHVEAVFQLGQVWPTPGSAVNYSLVIDRRRFDTYLAANTLRPVVSDCCIIVPGSSAEWDNVTQRVTMRIPREFLRRGAVYAPYEISAIANFGPSLVHVVHDDWAPEPGQTVGLAAPPERLPAPVEDPSDDDDRDGVLDASDRCPAHPAVAADGCTRQTPTRVQVSIDGVVVGAQDVFADYGAAAFAIPVELPRGQHTLRVDWLGDGLLATTQLAVTQDKHRNRTTKSPLVAGGP